MKQGKSVRCARWLRENSTVVSAHLKSAEGSRDEFIVWVYPDGGWSPMTFSHTNVLAEDWEVLPD